MNVTGKYMEELNKTMKNFTPDVNVNWRYTKQKYQPLQCNIRALVINWRLKNNRLIL
jgi:hypothetical protein